MLFSARAERLATTLGASSRHDVELTEIRSGNGIRYFEFRDICGNWIGVCHYPET